MENFKNKVLPIFYFSQKIVHFSFVSFHTSLIRYFAHPENLLLCGLLSPFSSDYVKQKSLDKILEGRKKQKKCKAKYPRKYFPPS